MKKLIKIANKVMNFRSGKKQVAVKFYLTYVFLIFQTAFSQDGSLDSTFGANGIVTTNFGVDDNATATAIQTDGKIVVVGRVNFPNNSDFAVVRYNMDGSLDTSFGTNGKVTTNMGNILEKANDVAIQTDGKIVVIGETYNVSKYEIAMVRYNPNGSLDTTFDFDGKVITSIGSGSAIASAVTLQTNGKIIVVGHVYTSISIDFSVLRYNADGSLDTTFSDDGIVNTNINNTSLAEDVKIQLDGKIVVVGSSFYSGFNSYFVTVRYTTDGSLDTTFDTDGIITDVLGYDDSARSIAIQSDGKIVVAGTSANGLNNTDFAVVRYTTFGSLDTTFGNNGKVTSDLSGSQDFANTVAIQVDGKILVSGSSLVGANFDFTVVRYTIYGALDPDFGTNGKVTTSINSSDYAQDMIIQPDGKIVLVGDSNNGSNTDFTVVRYNNHPLLLNDNCNTATQIDSFTFHFVQANGSATSGGIVSCNFNGEMNDGEWYSFIGNGNSVNVTLTAVESTYDPKIGVYTGTCGAFGCVVSADIGLEGDGESITIPNTIMGITYYINIGHYSSFEQNPEGNFTLHVTDYLLANDDCIAATQITNFPYTFIETNGELATNNGGSSSICADGLNDGEWFSFTGNGGNVTVALTSVWPTYDPQLAVYSGNCNALSCVVTTDIGYSGGSETTTFATAIGTNYFVNIGQYSSTVDNPENNFSLSVTTNFLDTTNFELSKLKVFPNPVRDILFLDSELAISKVSVFNLLGQEVLTTSNENLT